MRLCVLYDGIERINEDVFELLVHDGFLPEVTLAVLHPLEVGSSDSAGVGEDIGDDEDTFIADLAVATGAGQIKTGSASRTEFVDRPPQDPERRCPDISRARDLLGWEPHVDLDE